jgi:hypothetical protein
VVSGVISSKRACMSFETCGDVLLFGIPASFTSSLSRMSPRGASFVRHGFLLQPPLGWTRGRLQHAVQEVQTCDRSVVSDLCSTLAKPLNATRPGAAVREILLVHRGSRLIHLTLLMKPSTMPLFQDCVHALTTASASSASPSTKPISSTIPEARTSAFHFSKPAFPSRLREP